MIFHDAHHTKRNPYGACADHNESMGCEHNQICAVILAKSCWNVCVVLIQLVSTQMLAWHCSISILHTPLVFGAQKSHFCGSVVERTTFCIHTEAGGEFYSHLNPCFMRQCVGILGTYQARYLCISLCLDWVLSDREVYLHFSVIRTTVHSWAR